MGLFSSFKNQFIDIIEWAEESPGVLVHRFDRFNNEIKYGAKLIVRPGQKAVFVSEGQIADVFRPGTHTLETKNIPILRTLLSLPYNFESPFKAEVYFIKTTEQLDRKWGTPSPVMLRDADFGIVRLRARGNYSYVVGEDKKMITKFVGARSEFRAEELEDQVRAQLVSSFSDCLGEHKIAALDLAAKYDEIGKFMFDKLKSNFSTLGLELQSFAVENISLPEEVQKAIDQRSSMGALGNLNNFSQYQAANAVRDAAQNSGAAGNTMGMMMGSQMAGGAGNALFQQQQAQPAAAPPPPIPAGVKFFVAVNGQQTGPFDLPTLQGMIGSGSFSRDSMVWKEGMAAWSAASTVSELSSLFGSAPPPIPPPL
jgi:membrane protease subunit (stomatin/prohibitin family)